MRYLEIINLIERTAQLQPSVNMVVPDNVERLNHIPNAKYGAFVWQPGQHEATVENDMMRYRFTFFYADRIVRDRLNDIEAQSVGIDTLNNIIRTLAEELDVDSWTLDTFSNRLADVCAGAYATVTISVPIESPCWENYEGGYLLTAEGWIVQDVNGFNVKVRQ